MKNSNNAILSFKKFGFELDPNQESVGQHNPVRPKRLTDWNLGHQHHILRYHPTTQPLLSSHKQPND